MHAALRTFTLVAGVTIAGDFVTRAQSPVLRACRRIRFLSQTLRHLSEERSTITMPNPAEKSRPFPQVRLNSRRWPNRTIEQTPIWMSTDLRDGNQSLIEPMSIEAKLEFFEMLVKIGFKEIEVGFPSASQTDFDFVRKLIDEQRVPDDVTIEVLVQSRRDLIDRTFEACAGVSKVIVHLYSAIAPSFRKIVFNQSKDEVKALAVEGTRLIKESRNARRRGRTRTGSISIRPRRSA